MEETLFLFRIAIALFGIAILLGLVGIWKDVLTPSDRAMWRERLRGKKGPRKHTSHGRKSGTVIGEWEWVRNTKASYKYSHPERYFSTSGCTVGRPKAVGGRTVEELEAQDYIGMYAPAWVEVTKFGEEVGRPKAVGGRTVEEIETEMSAISTEGGNKILSEAEVMGALHAWSESYEKVLSLRQSISAIKDTCPEQPKKTTVEGWNAYTFARDVYRVELDTVETEFARACYEKHKAQECLLGILPLGVWFEHGDRLVGKFSHGSPQKHILAGGRAFRLKVKPVSGTGSRGEGKVVTWLGDNIAMTAH